MAIKHHPPMYGRISDTLMQENRDLDSVSRLEVTVCQDKKRTKTEHSVWKNIVIRDAYPKTQHLPLFKTFWTASPQNPVIIILEKNMPTFTGSGGDARRSGSA